MGFLPIRIWPARAIRPRQSRHLLRKSLPAIEGTIYNAGARRGEDAHVAQNCSAQPCACTRIRGDIKTVRGLPRPYGDWVSCHTSLSLTQLFQSTPASQIPF